MKHTKLANTMVPRVGLGCMGMSEFYGNTDEDTSLLTLKQAFDLGYRHFDTADMYGYGHNEKLLGKFIKDNNDLRDDIFLCTKGGIIRDPDNKYNITVNGSRDYIKKACEDSLKRLETDYIDLYYLHRPDPNIAIEETVSAMKELVDEGKIKAIGLSEVSSEQIRAASSVHTISAVQSELSLWSREAEESVLPCCEELDIAFVAFSPLGRGFLSGAIDQSFLNATSEDVDFRKRIPRFSDENIENNLAVLNKLEAISERNGLTLSEVSLAWVLAKSKNIHIIPGSKTPKYLPTNFNSQNIELSQADINEIESLFTPDAIQGTRYPQAILEKSS
ncbi:MAG: aldo/keto reductase [Cellvibrionales bacterium]|nr:aldo/keto reductase [Cellvibrionales bacterium]